MTATHHCDVAIVGAGPAGLAAAAAAGRAGVTTLLVDAGTRPGGQYYRQPARARQPGSTTQARGALLYDEARAAGAVHWGDTAVWNAERHARQVVLDTIAPETGHVRVLARAVVVAAGAHERFVPVPGWTLPGVLSAGGIQTFLKEQDLSVGSRVVLGGTGPLQLVVAGQLAARGVQVAAVFELNRLVARGARSPLSTAAAMWGQWERLCEAGQAMVRLLRQRGRIRSGWTITEVLGTTRVEGVRAAPIGRDGLPDLARAREIACDAVGLHHSLIPNTELLRLLGAGMAPSRGAGGLVPRRSANLETSIESVFAAGDGTGIGGVTLSLLEGSLAGGAAAARALGTEFQAPTTVARLLRRERRFQELYAQLFTVPSHLGRALARVDTVLCRCESVTVKEVDAAIDQGATTPWLVKSVTRAGMGPCQGRICGPVVDAHLRASESADDELASEACPRVARAPLAPVPIRVLAEEVERA